MEQKDKQCSRKVGVDQDKCPKYYLPENDVYGFSEGSMIPKYFAYTLERL